jgi:broad specificity phosphatase PhoE
MRMVPVYLLRHGEADYRPVRHRGWPGSVADLAPLSDDTFSWRSAEKVRGAVSDFDAHGGEWPAGTARAWEPLSQLRDRSAAALQDEIGGLPGHEVVILVCHGMVIWSLTGVPKVQDREPSRVSRHGVELVVGRDSLPRLGSPRPQAL